MPDLSAKLAHLEALRGGAWPQPWHGERNGGEIEVYGPEEADDDRGPLATFDCSENADLAIDLVNASPWLIPLAGQAERLAALVTETLPLVCVCSDVVEHGHLKGCPLERMRSALFEFEAIKKEAENG